MSLASILAGATVTLADLPPPLRPALSAASGAGGSVEFYPPVAAAGNASPPANFHAEVSPVHGADGGG